MKTAPAEQPDAPSPQARALDADGALSLDDSSPDLSEPVADEYAYDPSAQLDAIPAAQFGLQDEAELSAPDVDVAPEPAEAVELDEADSPFGAADEEGLGVDPSELLPPTGAAGIGIPLGNAADATPPPLPTATPPPLPTAPPPLPSEPAKDDAIQFADEIADDELRAMIEIPRFSGLKVVDAIPRAFADNGLVLETGRGRKARIEYDKVQGMAVAAVSGLARSPVVVIDLLLNWNDGCEDLLRSVRLRSDQFDPRRLVEAPTQMEAFRGFLAQLAERCPAALLPDERSALGDPLCKQPDLASYERAILQVAE